MTADKNTPRKLLLVGDDYKMKISIHSCYNYALCESEMDSEELVKEAQIHLDEGFGQTGGVSLKKGYWERVVITEEDIINYLSGNDEYDKGIYYCYTDKGKQCWDETTLFSEISDYIYEYCRENEKIVELGDNVNRQVFIQNNLVRRNF